MTKATWVGKSSLPLHLHVTMHNQKQSEQELKLSRNQESGADSESMQKCLLLALHGLFCMPSYGTQSHQVENHPK